MNRRARIAHPAKSFTIPTMCHVAPSSLRLRETIPVGPRRTKNVSYLSPSISSDVQRLVRAESVNATLTDSGSARAIGTTGLFDVSRTPRKSACWPAATTTRACPRSTLSSPSMGIDPAYTLSALTPVPKFLTRITCSVERGSAVSASVIPAIEEPITNRLAWRPEGSVTVNIAS